MPTSATLTQFAYFRTQGGPGLADLSIPQSGGSQDLQQQLTNESGQLVTLSGALPQQPALRTALNSLAPYVRATWPPAVGLVQPPATLVSQKSSVHTSPSLHTTTLAGLQMPPAQASPLVHGLLSLHAALLPV